MVCIFCSIANKEIPADFLYEDNDVMAFKNIKPSAPIHYLVMPKMHIQSISHLEANHKDIISKLIFTAKKLADESDLKGYKLVFNVGRTGGQIIDHLHLHLLAGWTQQEDIDAIPDLALDK